MHFHVGWIISCFVTEININIIIINRLYSINKTKIFLKCVKVVCNSAYEVVVDLETLTDLVCSSMTACIIILPCQ